MKPSRIPCTATVLTRNGAAGIHQCLKSLDEFAEILMQDGGSTDGTREIAFAFDNVRIIDQNPAHLDSTGRIRDFSAVRNDGIVAAAHDWIFVVDSDEEVDPDLVKEVRNIVEEGKPGVYEAFRRFYLDGERIEHGSWYPAIQIRLFHRSLTDGYIKPVHERLRLKSGVETRLLKSELPTPLPLPHTLVPKYDRYLRLEAERLGIMPFGKWIRWVFLRNIRSIAGLCLRIAWIWLLPRRGKRMPLAYEYLYLRQSMRVMAFTFPPIARRQLRKKDETASQTSSI